MTDEDILKIYMQGFNDELKGITRDFQTKTEIVIYTIGQKDAIIGDDIPSYDYRSSAEILKTIKDAIALC